MIVRFISIRRENDWGSHHSSVDLTKPMRATIEVQGTTGKVELFLSEELSRRVVEIIADEIAAAGRATAEAMTAEAFNGLAIAGPAK